MKHSLMTSILFFCMALTANAADFAPTLLKINAPETIEYIFDGGSLEIPVQVEGRTAGLVFSVFTNGKADDIPETTNGYLGWHYVNHVDTCIYYSPLKSVQAGSTIITWDGRDQDGHIADSGNYTYYIWAFDNQGSKEIMCSNLHADEGFDYITDIRETDLNGLPLDRPLWYNCIYDDESGTTSINQWEIGQDPQRTDLIRTSVIPLPEGWEHRGDPLMQPDNMFNFILSVGHSDSLKGSMLKYRFVGNGTAEPVLSWGGDSPFATIFDTAGGNSAGVSSDGVYLYTTDSNIYTSDEPDADFYIYSMDGALIEEIDLSPWWSSREDFDDGGQMNGGPDNFEERGGYIFLNSHASCIAQMISPARYLETGNYDDLFVWTSGNGDYVHDKNFEETADRPWTCNDYTMYPDNYSIGTDANLFSIYNAYDAGAVSFSMIGPDGTGLGFYAFAGETAGYKRGQKIIDSGTPYDGLYCDNEQAMGTGWWGPPPPQTKIYFIGHDSFRGEIRLAAHYLYITSLNGGSYYQGDILILLWDYQGVDTVDIEFSADNGVSWQTLASEYPAESGEYSFPAPEVVSSACRIRISDTGALGIVSVNSHTFSIRGPSISFTSPSMSGTRATGTVFPVRWSSDAIETVSIEYSLDGGETWNLIAVRIDSDENRYEWLTPDIESENVYLRIYDADRPEYIAYSPMFSLKHPYIKLLTPKGGEEYAAGDWIPVRWEYFGSGHVLFDYSADGGETWVEVFRYYAFNRSANWTIPDITSTNCFARLRDEDNPDLFDISDAPFTIIGGTGVERNAPHDFALFRNSPNPFNPVTVIPFSLPDKSPVRMDIFSASGNKVATVADAVFSAGRHSVEWDASDHASGIYFCRLSAGSQTATGKMLLLK